jgi:hypothetical protein
MLQHMHCYKLAYLCPWTEKEPELMRLSLLPINLQLHNVSAWDEGAIEIRGKELFERALSVWPAPESWAERLGL